MISNQKGKAISSEGKAVYHDATELMASFPNLAAFRILELLQVSTLSTQCTVLTLHNPPTNVQSIGNIQNKKENPSEQSQRIPASCLAAVQGTVWCGAWWLLRPSSSRHSKAPKGTPRALLKGGMFPQSCGGHWPGGIRCPLRVSLQHTVKNVERISFNKGYFIW